MLGSHGTVRYLENIWFTVCFPPHSWTARSDKNALFWRSSHRLQGEMLANCRRAWPCTHLDAFRWQIG